MRLAVKEEWSRLLMESKIMQINVFCCRARREYDTIVGVAAKEVVYQIYGPMFLIILPLEICICTEGIPSSRKVCCMYDVCVATCMHTLCIP